MKLMDRFLTAKVEENIKFHQMYATHDQHSCKHPNATILQVHNTYPQKNYMTPEKKSLENYLPFEIYEKS